MLEVLIFYFLSFLIAQPLNLHLKYYQARFFSILLLSLFSYSLSFFMPFKISFYFVLLIFVAIAAIYVARNGFNIDRKCELLFAVVFAYFIFLRSLDPNIFGAEKFMDMAFINSILKSKTFPPNDPYFAGGKLNIYYYFGHVIGAVVTLISFAKPEVGYNIAMATIPAFSFLVTFGFLNEFLENKFAILGSVFVLFSGNLYAAFEFFYKLLNNCNIGFLFYWNATRVIEDSTFGYAITEFPYFSFIHADFHAHVVAIPITLLCLSIFYDFYNSSKLKGYFLIPLLFILFATNPWSFPTIFLLFSTILLVTFKYKKDLLLILSSSFILVILLYLSMKNASSKLYFAEERTNLIQFIEFFGIQIAFAYYYFIDEIKMLKQSLILMAISVFSYFFIPIGLVITPLIFLSLKKLLKEDIKSSFIFAACVTIMAAEFFVIDCRMNTIFKFYLTSWILLTIAAATKIKDIFKVSNKFNFVMMLLFVLSLIYPVFATPVRYYKSELSLDGLEFMKKSEIDDYKAINWLKDKDGIVVEVVCDCYSYCSRISTFTGNPTIVAWPCHEVHWRGNGKELVERMEDVREIYTSKNCSKVVKLLEKYNAKYIVVGNEERRIYGASINNFEKCGLKKVFECNKTIIFEVIT